MVSPGRSVFSLGDPTITLRHQFCQFCNYPGSLLAMPQASTTCYASRLRPLKMNCVAVDFLSTPPTYAVRLASFRRYVPERVQRPLGCGPTLRKILASDPQRPQLPVASHWPQRGRDGQPDPYLRRTELQNRYRTIYPPKQPHTLGPPSCFYFSRSVFRYHAGTDTLGRVLVLLL